MTLDKIQAYAFDLNDSAARSLEKFSSNLRTNPSYAFTWGENAMHAAAQVDVAAYINEWVRRAEEMGSQKETVALAILSHAMSETLRMATQTSQSTSGTSNAMERYKMAVWAELARKHFDNVRFSNDHGVVVLTALPK